MNKLSKIISGLTVATLTHVASMEATNFRVQFSDELKTAIRKTIDAKIPEWREMMWSYACPDRVERSYISLFKRVDRVLEERLQARVKNLNIDFRTCAKIADSSFKYKEFQNKDFEKDEFTHKYTLLYLSPQSSEETVKQAYKYLVNDLQETMETFFETQELWFKGDFPYVLWFFDPDLGVKRVIHTAIMNSCIKPLAKKIIYEYRTMYSFYKKVLEKNVPEETVSFAYAECLYGEYRKLFLKEINDENKEEFKSHNRRVKTLEIGSISTTFMQFSGCYQEVVKEKVFKKLIQSSVVMHDDNKAYLPIDWVKDCFDKNFVKTLYKQIFNAKLDENKAGDIRVAVKKVIEFETTERVAEIIAKEFIKAFKAKGSGNLFYQQAEKKIENMRKNFNAVIDELAKK